MAPGAPRLDPEMRRQHRFYEALFLLHVLDPRGGDRLPFQNSQYLQGSTSSDLNNREFRQNFLNHLAYVCDYRKGGETVTSLAVEAQPSMNTFWLTSNTTPSHMVTTFLQKLLDIVRAHRYSDGNAKAVETKIADLCLDFNAPKIAAYRTLIQKPVKSCLRLLKTSTENEDYLLHKWLETFIQHDLDHSSLCRFAFQQRACSHMKQLQRHIGHENDHILMSDFRRQDFATTRHFIGRLGSHLRSAREITAASWRLPELFETFTIKVLPSPVPNFSPPRPDHKTTLDGIISRMMPAESQETKAYQDSIAALDTKYGILNKIRAIYGRDTFKPIVHAELNLLEFFYNNKLQFFGNDRFIACSKPACYCCHLYIEKHPGDFVKPASHGIRYTNWCQPDVIDPKDKKQQEHKRDMLNEMTTSIRREALRQILKCKGQNRWHADSTTGITPSIIENAMVVAAHHDPNTLDLSHLSLSSAGATGSRSTQWEVATREGDSRASRSPIVEMEPDTESDDGGVLL